MLRLLAPISCQQLNCPQSIRENVVNFDAIAMAGRQTDLYASVSLDEDDADQVELCDLVEDLEELEDEPFVTDGQPVTDNEGEKGRNGVFRQHTSSSDRRRLVRFMLFAVLFLIGSLASFKVFQHIRNLGLFRHMTRRGHHKEEQEVFIVHAEKDEHVPESRHHKQHHKAHHGKGRRGLRPLISPSTSKETIESWDSTLD